MKIVKWIGIVLLGVTLLFFIMSFTIGTNPENGFMNERLEEMEVYFDYRDASNSTISEVDVAWQLDHSLKVINNIIKSLIASDPRAYQINFNISRTLVFTRGDFPRGVAQAPESVIPSDDITDQELKDQLQLAREQLASMAELDPRASYNHAVFGLLDRNETARLLVVHTDHHLKIIRDILEAEQIAVNN